MSQRQDVLPNGLHPEVRKFYTESGLQYVKKAEDRIAEYFDQVTRNSNHSYRITQIYRSKRGGFNKEYLWWFEEDNAHDYNENEVQKFSVRGKYEKPVGHWQYNEKSGKRTCVGISRLETKYETEFTPKLVEELREKGEITDDTLFYAEAGSRTYGDINYFDFKDLPFSDLELMGKTGIRPDKKSHDKKVKEE